MKLLYMGKIGTKLLRFNMFKVSRLLLPALIIRKVCSWPCLVSRTIWFIVGSFSSVSAF